jgi:hypothetical protein
LTNPYSPTPTLTTVPANTPLRSFLSFLMPTPTLVLAMTLQESSPPEATGPDSKKQKTAEDTDTDDGFVLVDRTVAGDGKKKEL